MHLMNESSATTDFERFRILGNALFLLLLVLTAQVAVPSAAQARQGFAAIAVDARTGRVLYARHADSYRLPASITKVMTAYMLFREIRKGRYSLSSRLVISRHAASMQPSKLGLKPGSTITVDQAIRAILTKSANDIAVAIAENIAGSESRFAARMTRVARAMGMTRTTFRNASGLPRPKNVTTARDLATLSLRIQRDFPKLYKRYFGLRHFRFRGRVMRNHNRLLGRVRGMDGLKTGYTRAAGYNLAASAMRNGRRVVAVVLGAPSSRARNAYMANLIERMFRSGKLRRGTMIAALAGRPPGWKPARTQLASTRQKPRSTTSRKKRTEIARVDLPRPALGSLVRRLTAPLPRPRPAEVSRQASIAQEAPADTTPLRKIAQADRPERDTTSATEGTKPSATSSGKPTIKVEGRIFASVRPEPGPGPDSAEKDMDAVMNGSRTPVSGARLASLGGGSGPAMDISSGRMDEKARETMRANETVIEKSDALLPVSAFLRSRTHTETEPANTAPGETPLPPERSDGDTRNAAPVKEKDGSPAAGNAEEKENVASLVTATVANRESAMDAKTGETDPELQRRLASWNIQLGSFPGETGAVRRLDEATRKFGTLLRGKEGFTMIFRKDGRTYYRARFAGFDRRTALRACKMMKRKGMSCFALAPSAGRS